MEIDIDFTCVGVINITLYNITDVLLDGLTHDGQNIPAGTHKIEGRGNDNDSTIDFFDQINLTGVHINGLSRLKYLSNMFQDCTNLTSVTMPPSVTKYITSMNSMFRGCNSLLEIPMMDTNNVTNMNSLCWYCKEIQSFPDLFTFNVTDFNGIFEGCKKLTSLGTNFATSKGIYMSNMFKDTSILQNIPSLDTRNMISFSGTDAFTYSSVMTPAPTGTTVRDGNDLIMGGTFNLPLEPAFKMELRIPGGGEYYFDWDGDFTAKDSNGNPVDISSSPATSDHVLMIEGNYVTRLLIGNIDTAIIHRLGPDLTNLNAFALAQVTGITPLNHFECHDDFSQITSMYRTFAGCNLTSFPSLDTSNVTNWATCFQGNNFIIGPTLDYSSATNVGAMFAGNSEMTCLPNMDTTLIGGTSKWSHIFQDCPVLLHPTPEEILLLESIEGLDYSHDCSAPILRDFKMELRIPGGGEYYFGWDGDIIAKDSNGNPVDISSSPATSDHVLMIEGNNVTSVLIGNIDTAIIHKLGPSLTSLNNFAWAQGTGITPLNHFECHDDFSQITSMIQAFRSCNLTSFPALDTSNVTDWSACFAGNNFITGPTLDYSSATDVNNMFSYNSEMTCLPNMDTRQVPPKTDWDFMHIFWDCPVLLHPTTAEINLLEVKTGGSGLDYSHDCSDPPIPQVKDIYYTRDQNLNNFMVSYENNNSYRITLNEQRNG